MHPDFTVADIPFRLPAELTELNRWVLWRFEHRGKYTRPAKVPLTITGVYASSTNPAIWTSFETARDVWPEQRQAFRWEANPKPGRVIYEPRGFAGVGFVFTKEDGLVGIDLDDSLDDLTRVKPWARGIVERFSDTYMEISPSGLGLKIFARGSIPSAVKAPIIVNRETVGALEMYDTRRFFTVTGWALDGVPIRITDHAADVLALHQHFCAPAASRGGRQQQPGTAGRIPIGRRHKSLVGVAGNLRRLGAGDDVVRTCLEEFNQREFEQPKTQREIERIAKGSRKWQTGCLK